jgi:NDP-sugar pyrophosphorylase family protein
LCPVANVPLVDHALVRVARAVGEVAVNVCTGRAAFEAHLGGRAHLSFEEQPLGTAGALGHLRGWLAGRGALVVNGDTWCPAELRPFVDGWDGERVRVLVTGGVPLHARSGIVASLLPWSEVARLPAAPLGLWEGGWRDRLAEGRLESVGYEGPFVDCATVADYLAANRAALAHAGRASLVGNSCRISGSVRPGSVVGDGSTVAGTVERSVLWPGAVVSAGEVLVDAVRVDDRVTVLVR